jgi:lipopolysaccharide transport system permease protein
MIKSLYYFIRLIVLQRNIIFVMGKREIASQYAGSLLGFIWTFINPLIMILVFWVVFSVGLKAQPLNNVPFVVWLTAGLSAWFAFSDMVGGAAGSIVGNSNLIKKTLFHSQILPVVKIFSSLITHSIFLVVLVGLIIFQKLPFSFYYFQFLYYLLGLCSIALGLGWMVAALNVFTRDVTQIIGIVLQVGLWATPILWDINIMPQHLQLFFKLNPMFYIVQGYRESFIYFKPFWHHPLMTIYFWIFSSITLFLGALVFKSLKSHFAEVL